VEAVGLHLVEAAAVLQVDIDSLNLNKFIL